MWEEGTGARGSPTATRGRDGGKDQVERGTGADRASPVAAGSFADHAAGVISATSTLAAMGHGPRGDTHA